MNKSKSLLFFRILAVYSFLLIASPALAGWGCSDFLARVAEKVGLYKPKITEQRVVRLREADERKAWLLFTHFSDTVDTIDNFSSAATQQLIFSRKLKETTRNALNRFSATQTPFSNAVKRSMPDLNEEALFFIESFERRFIFAAKVINKAAKISGKGNLVNTNRYRILFRTNLVRAISELVETTRSKLFPEDMVDTIESIETSFGLGRNSFNAERKEFNSDFLRAVGSQGDPEQAIQNISEYLKEGLEALPIGISYRPIELTSTVRFGYKHFYGNWFNYNATHRTAYVKGSKKLGGVFDAELKVSIRKKKELAIGLDNTHQTLDVVFGKKEACSRYFNTCGSYAPFFFISHRVPIISPFYVTPFPQMISLGLQRLLRMPTVKNFKYTHSQSTTLGIVPVFLLHDAGIMNWERIGWTVLFTKTGSVLYHLASNISIPL